MRKLTITWLAAILLIACNSKQPADSVPTADTATTANHSTTTAAKTEESPEVDAESGATQVANETLFNGILVASPQNRATVTPVMGGIVEQTYILPGQYVKKGSTIATVKNPDFILLQQNYLDAKAQYEYLHTEFVRQQSLLSQDASSKKKFQQSKADYLSMKSRLDACAAQLQLLGIPPSTIETEGILPALKIEAPISGYVTSMNLNLGKYLNDGDAICELIAKKDILLKITAYEKDLESLEAGSKIEFRVNGMGDRCFEATLLSVGQEVDEVNRSLNAYAKVESDDTLFRPGMYISARIKKNK